MIEKFDIYPKKAIDQTNFDESGCKKYRANLQTR
jgi:hypothetical protein